MREVILLQHLHHFGNGKLSLGRHQLKPLLMYRRMQTDCQMALALFQISAQILLQSHARHRYSLRTPCKSIVGSENFQCLHHVVKIVERFTLSHEDKIGESFLAMRPTHLTQDVGSFQISLKALFSRLAKEAVHLASHLCGNAERTSLSIRDINRFDEMTAQSGKQILLRSIHTGHPLYRLMYSHLIAFLQSLSHSLRNVRHLIYRRHIFLIQPLCKLFSAKAWHTYFSSHAS